jgi:uncharacterized protein YutD
VLLKACYDEMFKDNKIKQEYKTNTGRIRFPYKDTNAKKLSDLLSKTIKDYINEYFEGNSIPPLVKRTFRQGTENGNTESKKVAESEPNNETSVDTDKDIGTNGTVTKEVNIFNSGK